MQDLLIWGATGQAKVLYELIDGTAIQLVALVDNRIIPSAIPGIPMLHGNPDLVAWLARREGTHNLCGAVAIGGQHGKDRLMIMELLKSHGIALQTLIHRTAFVARNARLGEGCQILAQAAICANASLGQMVIINTAASVDHDCEIGNGVHLAPGAKLAGEVTVGARSFIGIGAIVLPRITIGEDAIIGAGAVVTKHVESGAIMIGNPARRKT